MATNQAKTERQTSMQADTEAGESADEPLGVPVYDGRNPESPPSGSMWYRADLNTIVGKLDNEIVDILTGATIGADFSDGGAGDGSGGQDGGDGAGAGGGWFTAGDDAGGADAGGDGEGSDAGSLTDWLAPGGGSASDTDDDEGGNESDSDGGDFPW